MRLKEGVSVTGVRPELLLALQIADGVYAAFGHELVVTSLNDGKHSRTSLHYAGAAADLRTRDLQPGIVPKLVDSMRAALGVDFDVVLERDHIHLEWQPRRR